MSLSEEKSSPSSTLSSNCESPLSTKVSKNKQELSPIPIFKSKINYNLK